MSEVAQRDSHGRWLPGVSPNPGGRPEALRAIVDLARRYTSDAVEALHESMTDAKQPGMARVRAAETLLSRAWGVPIATAALADLLEPQQPLRFRFLMDDDDPPALEAEDAEFATLTAASGWDDTA